MRSQTETEQTEPAQTEPARTDPTSAPMPAPASAPPTPAHRAPDERSPDAPGVARPVMTDAVVIGAGYAGLSAALRLHEQGLGVVVLEASSRVGGRVLSEERPSGPVVDHGGQWVGPTQKHLLALAERFGCRTFPTWETGQHIEVWHDGSRVGYAGAAPASGPGIAEYLRITALLDDLALTVDPEQPWLTPHFTEWDGLSAESFFREQTADPDALVRLALAVQGVWCAEPREISLFHVLFYIRAAGSYEQLMETGGCAQDGRFATGAAGPARAVAELLGDRIRLGERVCGVEQHGSGVRVRTASGAVVEARRAVVALPPPAARSITFSPALPEPRSGWIAHSPMGRVAKIHAVYSEPFWRADGLSGIATLYGSLPVGVVFDNSPEDGSAGVLVAFVYGDRAGSWAGLDEEQRRTTVLGSLRAVVGERAERPVDYTETLWEDDEFARGGYAAYVTPGGWSGYGEHGWREPTGAVHWAGTETATVWNGYIDGAIASGYRAADEIAGAIAVPTAGLAEKHG
ncbi:FAD-dependent oxidoreductase [Streptomyces sp. NBC_00440]|uniref:flavin monoamine oxidase family protein n=1 Tax=Streptomyces sp. NBC_00440 TaxID=2975741 RepID=UPI002E1A080F